MNGNEDSMEGEEMEWELSFDEPDRPIPDTIPVSNLMKLVKNNDQKEVVNTVTTRPASNPPAVQLIIVPDTNIWLSSLGLLDQLLITNFENAGPPSILIPWMVLQELDGLMKGPRKGVAQRSIRRIENLLSIKHPRVRGQKPSEVALGQNKFQGSIEDDSILQCALQCCDATPSAQVIFLTDDRNLRSKAMILDQPNLVVSSSTTAFKDIEKDFAICKEAVRKATLLKIVEKHAVASERLDKTNMRTRICSETETNSHPDNQSRGKKRKIAIAKRKIDQEPPVVDPPPKSKLLARPPSPKRVKRSHASASASKNPDYPQPSTTSVQPTKKSLVSGEPKPQSSKIPLDSFSTVSKLLQDTLAYIIEFQMKADCGDENWLSSLKIKPPWTLSSALKCISLHWIAIFSFVFGSRGKASLDLLSTRLNKYQTSSRQPKFVDSSEGKALERSIVETAVSLFNCGNVAKLSSKAMKEPQVQVCRRTLLKYLD